VSVEKIPEFTAPAAKLWTAIPPETRKLLLSNVWCSKCRHEVTIANFTGAGTVMRAPQAVKVQGLVESGTGCAPK